MTATARRGHGEGSVYRDAANGTWVSAISLGWRPGWFADPAEGDWPHQDRGPGEAQEAPVCLVGHASSRTTETVYRYELRPVITTGADVMDKIFTAAQRQG